MKRLASIALPVLLLAIPYAASAARDRVSTRA